MGVTKYDLAFALDTSPFTVSRALNHSPLISEIQNPEFERKQ